MALFSSPIHFYCYIMVQSCAQHTQTLTHNTLSNDGTHFTQTYVHCIQGLNLFYAHALAFYSIELLVCLFAIEGHCKLILLSISVLGLHGLLYSRVVHPSLLFHVVDNFPMCMWSSWFSVHNETHDIFH